MITEMPSTQRWPVATSTGIKTTLQAIRNCQATRSLFSSANDSATPTAKELHANGPEFRNVMTASDHTSQMRIHAKSSIGGRAFSILLLLPSAMNPNGPSRRISTRRYSQLKPIPTKTVCLRLPHMNPESFRSRLLHIVSPALEMIPVLSFPRCIPSLG